MHFNVSKNAFYINRYPKPQETDLKIINKIFDFIIKLAKIELQRIRDKFSFIQGFALKGILLFNVIILYSFCCDLFHLKQESILYRLYSGKFYCIIQVEKNSVISINTYSHVTDKFQ